MKTLNSLNLKTGYCKVLMAPAYQGVRKCIVLKIDIQITKDVASVGPKGNRGQHAG